MKNGSSCFVCCHFFRCYVWFEPLIQILEFIIIVIVFIDGYDIPSVLRPSVADFHQVEGERLNDFSYRFYVFFFLHLITFPSLFSSLDEQFLISHDVKAFRQIIDRGIDATTGEVVHICVVAEMDWCKELWVDACSLASIDNAIDCYGSLQTAVLENAVCEHEPATESLDTGEIGRAHV